MIVQHFLKWVQTARVSERAAAAASLARTYIDGELPIEDRCAADAAMTLLLDDPSSKVRLALAEALSMSKVAPPQVISALACDQPDVAALVIARSPLLTDADLVQRISIGHPAVQRLIADRPVVSMAVSAAIAELGDAETCLVLLRNIGADIASLSFKRMTERFGDVATVREVLIADRRLPSECRHDLLSKLGDVLKQAPLVRALFGEAHAERVLKDACTKASVTLIDRTPANEFSALVEHLRLRGALTAKFIIRAVACGKIDFFGAALVALTGQSEQRVRTLLSSGFDTALSALFLKAGLVARTHGIILRALKAWREVAQGKRIAGPQEVSWMMMKELSAEDSDLSSLLKSIHLESLRSNARGHAVAIRAA